MRATCAGIAGVLPVTVSHYELRGTVRDANNQAIAGARVKIGRLMPFTDSRPMVLTGTDGSFSISSRFDPVPIEVSKDGYSFASVTPEWNRAATMTADLSLDAVTILKQGEGRLCNVLWNEAGYADCEAAGVTRRDVPISFRVPHNAQIVIRTYWPGPSATGQFVSDLRCNNQTIYNYRESDGLGLGYAVDATADCSYELVLSNLTGQRVLSYRYTIEIR